MPAFSHGTLATDAAIEVELLGAIGLLVPRALPLAAYGLIALLVAMFPANVHAAREGLMIAGRRATPLLWRLPLLIGHSKFAAFEVEALKPLSGGTQWLGRMYAVSSPIGVSRFLCVIEIATAFLLMASPWMPRAGVVGGALGAPDRRRVRIGEVQDPLNELQANATGAG